MVPKSNIISACFTNLVRRLYFCLISNSDSFAEAEATVRFTGVVSWVLLQFRSAPLISRLLEVRVRPPGQLGLGLGSDRVS